MDSSVVEVIKWVRRPPTIPLLLRQIVLTGWEFHERVPAGIVRYRRIEPARNCVVQVNFPSGNSVLRVIPGSVRIHVIEFPAMDFTRTGIPVPKIDILDRFTLQCYAPEIIGRKCL